MASKPAVTLPSMAPFPEVAWRARMTPEEWTACLDTWISLAGSHLYLISFEFEQRSVKDESVTAFLISYMAEMARSPDLASLGDLSRPKALRRVCFFLSNRLLDIAQPPERLFAWDFLANFCKVYGKAYSTKLIAAVWTKPSIILQDSLAALKISLTRQLEAGIRGDPTELEQKLKQLNHLLHVSPEAATFFMSGSDFLDALISCYKLMSPPLRRVIICTTYLCLIGLTDGSKPNFSLLTDQLYALNVTADAHKSGPANTNDSIVGGLVSETPILKQILQRIEASGTGLGRAKSVIAALEGFRTVRGRLKRPVKRVNKGKEVARGDGESGYGTTSQTYVYRMSLISQIQDLFPDLGSGFVMKLLDECNDDAEQVISHLLEGSLPPHLEQANHGEELSPTQQESSQRLPNPSFPPAPPQLPIRRNVFDNDEFDQLAVDVSRLHFGRRDPERTADGLLKDRSNAPNKTAILSALAAFDSDDDERDDTYDVEDVGGTIDSAVLGNNLEEANTEVNGTNDEALFRAFKMMPNVFGRDATTRRSKPRITLKEETGMADEAIEGWSLMLLRDPQRMRRLEMKFSDFSGIQRELAPTSWGADNGGSGTEESDGGGRGRGGGLRARGRGGHGRSRGNVADPTGHKEMEIARQRKEANKGSRANHNRRDQRAKKMARGGFPS